MFLPLELGCLLLLPLEPNLISVYNLAYPPHIINRYQFESLFDKTTPPNIDQAAPDLGICLQFGLVALTTS